MTRPCRSEALSHRNPAGFTLIELLVVIGIVALLIGLLLPVLGRARDGAKHLRTLSDLRQMMIGYSIYQDDHDGHVQFGYPPIKTFIDGGRLGVRIKGTDNAVLNDTTMLSPEFPAVRYPWRMHPYVGEIWEIIHSHQPEPPTDPYGLSIGPSLGLNSMYVGGQGATGTMLYNGFRVDPANTDNVIANRGEHVVFNRIEVKNPSRLLVFSETIQWVGSAPLLGDSGLHFVTPPRGNGHRWEAEGDDAIRSIGLFAGQITGAPLGRHGHGTAAGFFDGHAAGMSIRELEDMRYWANNATAADYDF